MNTLTKERLAEMRADGVTFANSIMSTCASRKVGAERVEVIDRLLAAEAQLAEVTSHRDLWHEKVQDLEAVKKRLEAQLAELLNQTPVSVPDYMPRLSVATLDNIIKQDGEEPIANAARMLAVELKFWHSAPRYARPVPPAASQPDEHRAEGIIFTANRMLAAWEAGFIDRPAKDTLDVATMIMSAIDMLNDATPGDFKRDFADEMIVLLREESKKKPEPASQPMPGDFMPQNLDRALTIMGLAIPESKEEFNFQSERWIQRLINAVLRMSKASQPYTVPDDAAFDAWTRSDVDLSITLESDVYMGIAKASWDACRAAMLQLSNSPPWVGIDWAKGCEPSELAHFRDRCRELVGVGSLVPDFAVFTNIENAIRRSNCLGAIERYMSVHIGTDENDDAPMYRELLNWGEEPAKYIETFKAALPKLSIAYSPVIPDGSVPPIRYMNRFTGVCFTLDQQPGADTDTDVYIPLVPQHKGE